MKKLLLFIAIAICLPFLITAQSSDDYVMFQTIKLTPKSGQSTKVMEGLKEHNDTYHTEGHTAVSVWQINSGEDAGSLSWIMGPLKWSDLDKADDPEHIPHWMEKVDPYVEMGEWQYWRLEDDMSYAPEGFQPKVHFVRFFTIEARKRDEAKELFKTFFKIYRENNFDMGLHVFSNEVPGEDEPQWAILWAYDNYASMDKNRKFWDLYEKSEGIDRREFFERWDKTTNFEGAQLTSLIPELSSN